MEENWFLNSDPFSKKPIEWKHLVFFSILCPKPGSCNIVVWESGSLLHTSWLQYWVWLTGAGEHVTWTAPGHWPLDIIIVTIMDLTMDSSSNQDLTTYNTIIIMDKMMDSRIDQDLTMDIITMDTMMGSSSDQDHTMDKMNGRSPAHPRTRTHATFLRISWFIVGAGAVNSNFFCCTTPCTTTGSVRSQLDLQMTRGGGGTGDWADLQRMSRENLDEG